MKQETFDRYAIIKTGGKQYQAIEGKTLAIEKLEAEEGAEVVFTEVLLRRLGADRIEVGQPFLDTPIKGTVVKHDRDEKIIVHKFKRRKKYSVRQGHRQPLTVVRITTI